MLNYCDMNQEARHKIMYHIVCCIKKSEVGMYFVQCTLFNALLERKCKKTYIFYESS